MSKYNNNNFLL